MSQDTNTKPPKNQDTKTEVQQEMPLQEEPFSSDIRAFCTLLARIVVRCLKEQNEQALHVLSLSSRQREKE